MILDNQRSQGYTGPGLSTDPSAENRLQSIRLLTVFICILSALLTVGLFSLLFTQLVWQLGILASLFAATAVFCVFALNSLYPRKAYFAGVSIVCLLFGLAALGASALLTGLGFPFAIVYLIFALMVSSMMGNDTQANLAIMIGILIAGLCGLATAYSPFQQITIEIISVITPAILGVLFMIYVTMQAMQFVTATLRIRLVTIFMAIVIIPLAILSIIQSRFMFNELTREADQAQLQAAQQAAFGVEMFITDTQKSLLETTKLEIFNKYLQIPVDKRKDTPEEIELKLSLKVLDASELKSNLYVSSFALLDMDGKVLYDSLNDRYVGLSEEIYLGLSSFRQGNNEGEETYFLVPARSGVPIRFPSLHRKQQARVLLYQRPHKKHKRPGNCRSARSL